MNRFGSRANLELWSIISSKMRFRTDQAGAFAKALTDKRKLLPKAGQFTQGV
jgi:hypothetical protein